MPQFDISTYSSQIFWLFLCLAPIYIVLTYSLLPRIKGVLLERTRITYEKRKEIEKMNLEISKIEDEIQAKIHESFQKIKKIKEESDLSTHIKIRDELEKADEELTTKKNEFIKNMDLFKVQISSNIDEGILNYSEILIKKVSHVDVNIGKLTQIFNKIKA